MKTKIEKNGSKVIVFVEGRVDTSTAPAFQRVLNKALKKANELVLDCKKMEYITSAGLRVVLSASKEISTRGKFTIVNASTVVKEVFDMTGFSSFVNIE